MTDRRNFPEGCPLHHPVLSKLLGKSCLEGCDGPRIIDKYEVVKDDWDGKPLELLTSHPKLCSLRSLEDQLKSDELLGIDVDREEVIYDTRSISDPKWVFVNPG